MTLNARSFSLLHFVRYVQEGKLWMMKQHPRARIPHYCPYPFSHFAIVAMNPASGTDGFQLMKGTPFDLLVGILQEFFAVDAQMVSDLVSCSTIHPHHQLNGLLFTDMSLFCNHLTHSVRSVTAWPQVAGWASHPERSFNMSASATCYAFSSLNYFQTKKYHIATKEIPASPSTIFLISSMVANFFPVSSLMFFPSNSRTFLP